MEVHDKGASLKLGVMFKEMRPEIRTEGQTNIN